MFVGRMSEAAEVITQYVSPDAGDVALPPEVAPLPLPEVDAFQEVAAPVIASPPAPPELAVDAPTMRVGYGGVLVPALEVAAPAVVKAADEAEIEPAAMNGHVRVAGESYTVIKGEIYAAGEVVGAIDDEFNYSINGKTGKLENLTPEILNTTGRKYNGEDAANLTPARVEMANEKIAPEELKFRYSEFGKGRISDLEPFAKAGELQEAFTQGLKWGFVPSDMAAYFEKLGVGPKFSGEMSRNQEIERLYYPGARAALEADGYTVGRYGIRVPFKMQALIDEVAPDKLPSIDQAGNSPVFLADYVNSKNPVWAAKAREHVAATRAAEAANPGFTVGPTRPAFGGSPTAVAKPAPAPAPAPVSVQAPVSKESTPTALERNVDALIAKHSPNADSAARARLSYLLLSIGKQTNKRSPEGLKQLLSFKEIAALLDASKPTLAESSPPSANPGGRPRSRAP